MLTQVHGGKVDQLQVSLEVHALAAIVVPGRAVAPASSIPLLAGGDLCEHRRVMRLQEMLGLLTVF